MKTNRKLLAVAVVVALLVTVVALVTTSTVKKFPANSPQYTVQQFLMATAAGDYEKAATYFAPGSACSVNDLETSYLPTNFRVELVDSSVTGNSAIVKVAVGLAVEGPFDSISMENHAYRLVRSDRWLVAGTPWPLYQCGMVKK